MDDRFRALLREAKERLIYNFGLLIGILAVPLGAEFGASWLAVMVGALVMIVISEAYHILRARHLLQKWLRET